MGISTREFDDLVRGMLVVGDSDADGFCGSVSDRLSSGAEL